MFYISRSLFIKVEKEWFLEAVLKATPMSAMVL
jgi:hypothetical protein